MANKLHVPLSVGTMDDARVIDAGPDAELLWYRALQLAKRQETDGVLTDNQLARLHPKAGKAIAALARVGLIRRHGDGWYLAGWLDWNQSTAAMAQRREQVRETKAAAGRKGAAARWQGDGTVPSPQMANAWQGDGSRNGYEAEQSRAEQSRASDVVDPVGTSQVRANPGFAPDARRNGEPAAVAGSLGTILGGLR